MNDERVDLAVFTPPSFRIPHFENGSFFQRPGYQVVNLAMRVQFPYEPLKCNGPFV